MRKWIVIAAALACTSAGVLATARGADDQAQKTEPRKETRTRTIVVDDGNGDALFRLAGDDGVRIGITVANLDDEQAKTMTGALVTGVRDESPAAKAGLKEKDVITEFDGEKVRSARQLSRLVSETPPGRTVSLAAMRDGKRVELRVAPEETRRSMLREGDMAPWTFERRLPPPELGSGERRFFFDMPEGGHHFEFHGPAEGDGDMATMPREKGRLGIGIQDLSDQLAEYFGTGDGVLVSSVTKDSPAAKAGVRAGDVITSVDDKPVTNGRELTAAVRHAEDGATLKLGYVRDKKAGTATATLAPRQEKPKRSGMEM